MAEELRIMENKSREDTNLSPVSKIEIYSFFDPFSKEGFKICLTFIYLLYSILNFDKIADNLKQSLLKGSKKE